MPAALLWSTLRVERGRQGNRFPDLPRAVVTNNSSCLRCSQCTTTCKDAYSNARAKNWLVDVNLVRCVAISQDFAGITTSPWSA